MEPAVIVGFSGGIDSQACALWCRRTFPAGRIVLLNSDAGGNEHPLTEEFVRFYSRTVFPVVTVSAIVADLGDVGTKEGFEPKRRRDQLDEKAPLTFDLLAWVKGRYPSRKAQFCTEYLKLMPQKRWLAENGYSNTDGKPFARYIGVRADESQLRRKCRDSEWDSYFGCSLFRPILTWSKQQCFDYVQEAGEPINPLYTMGFNRVGCAPCINSNKQDVRNWAARFPEMIDKVRRWEELVGRTFFAPCVPGKEINWIDEVVAWSKTERGGQQLSLPLVEADAATGQCVSKYGLCE